MPTHAGPNTKGQEDLVFGYDLGDTKNSFRGEPTTNSAETDMTSFTKDNGCTVTATGEYHLGQPVYRVYFPSGTLPRIRFNFAYTTGQTWNGSIYYKVVQSGDYMPQFFFRESGFGSGYTNTSFNTDGTWRRANLNYTFSSNGTCMFLLYRSNSSSTQPVYIDFAMPQVEVGKSHATQFVGGTRSATQGLIDLIGNSTIDLTNVSFDSNAQMTFDGTSDYATIDHNTVMRDTDSLVIEAVFQVYSQFGYYGGIIGKGTSDADEEYFLGIYPSGNKIYFDVGQGSGPYVNASQTINSNQYYHVVAMHERAGGTSTCSIYVNGEFVSNTTSGATNSVNTNTTDITIGSRWSNGAHSLNGDIPLLKMYNRIPTTSEIQANYNAIKGRFNI